MSLVRKSFVFGEASFDCWVFIIRNSSNVDEFWFKAKDIAVYLQYNNPVKCIANNVDQLWRKTWSELLSLNGGISNAPLTNTSHTLQNADSSHSHMETDNGDDDDGDDESAFWQEAVADPTTPSRWQPHTIFISEPGLYALVTRSKKPEAVRFTRWIYEEVLPSLRRTGSYTMPAVAAAVPPEKSQIFLELKSEMLQTRVEKMEVETRLIAYRADTERQLAVVRNDAEKQLAVMRSDAEKQLAVANANFQQQLALQAETARRVAAEEIHKLQTQLLERTHEIQTMEHEYRHEQTEMIHEFRNLIVYGVQKSAEKIDAAEVNAEMQLEHAEMHRERANVQEERANVALAHGTRVAAHLRHLNDTASIAPTEALREYGKNTLIVIFSEEYGDFFSVSRIQTLALEKRRFSRLVDGVWKPNHKTPTLEHFARRLLMCVEAANAVGSWALIRTTDLRLFFGTHPRDRSPHFFGIVTREMLACFYERMSLQLAELRPNAKMTPRMARFAAERFANAEDFVARCCLRDADDLCARIRLYVESASLAINHITSTPTTLEEDTGDDAVVAPHPPPPVAAAAERMITRKRAREERMRRMMASLAADDDGSLAVDAPSSSSSGINITNFSKNVKRWLNK